jgi:ATP-dependent Clp protease ATP-binding subunit ClpA
LLFVRLEKSALSKLSRNSRPEFVGRFTDKIVFKPLSLDTQIEIAKLTLQEQLQLSARRAFNVVEQGPGQCLGV